MTPAAPIDLRPATEQDAPSVLALWNQAFQPKANGRESPYGATDFSSTLASGDLLVAEQDDAIAGSVALFEPGAHPAASVARAGELEVSRLAVEATRRRRGVARVLLISCHAEAIRRGRTAVVLSTRPAQVEAHRLYRKLAYERVPGRDATDQRGHERHVYRVELIDPRVPGVVPYG